MADIFDIYKAITPITKPLESSTNKDIFSVYKAISSTPSQFAQDSPGIISKRELNIDDFKFQPIYGADNYLRRAQNQSFGEQIGKGLASTIANIPIGIMRDIGYLGALFSEWGSEQDYTNPIIELAEKARNLGGWGDVYRTHPDKIWDMADSAWWINNVGQTLESVGTFALEGIGLGRLLGALGTTVGKGLASSDNLIKLLDSGNDIAHYFKVAKATEPVIALRSSDAILASRQRIATLLENVPIRAGHIANSYTLAYVEGAQIAHDVYKGVYNKLILEGKTDNEAKATASGSARIAAQMNTALIGLTNLAVLAPLSPMGLSSANKLITAGENETTSSIMSRLVGLVENPKTRTSIFRPESLKKLVALETTQEFIEEAGINNWAEYSGNYYGNNVEQYRNTKDDNNPWYANDNHKVGYFEGLKTRVISDQALLEGLLGALGGFGQSMIMGNLKTQSIYNDKGEKIGSETAINKANRIKHEVATRILDNFKEDTEHIANIKKQLQELKDDGSIASKDKRDLLLQELTKPTRLQSVINGTGGLLVNTYKELQSTDNSVDLGIAAKEQIDNIWKQYTPVLQQMQNGQEITSELQQQHDDLKKQYDDANIYYNKVKGKTAAMDMGLALNENDNDYKVKAQMSIDLVQRLDAIKYNLERRYNFDNDEELSGYTKMVYHLHQQVEDASLYAEYHKTRMDKYKANIKQVLDSYNISLEEQKAYFKKLEVISKEEAVNSLKTRLNNMVLNSKEKDAIKNTILRLQNNIGIMTKEAYVAQVNTRYIESLIENTNAIDSKNLTMFNAAYEEALRIKESAQTALEDVSTATNRKQFVASWKKGMDHIDDQVQKANTLKQIVKIAGDDIDTITKLEDLGNKLDLNNKEVKEAYDIRFKELTDQQEHNTITTENKIETEQQLQSNENIIDPVSGLLIYQSSQNKSFENKFVNENINNIINPNTIPEQILNSPAIVTEPISNSVVQTETTRPGQATLMSKSLGLFEEVLSSVNNVSPINPLANGEESQENEAEEKVLTTPIINKEQSKKAAPKLTLREAIDEVYPESIIREKEDIKRQKQKQHKEWQKTHYPDGTFKPKRKGKEGNIHVAKEGLIRSTFDPKDAEEEVLQFFASGNRLTNEAFDEASGFPATTLDNAGQIITDRYKKERSKRGWMHIKKTGDEKKDKTIDWMITTMPKLSALETNEARKIIEDVVRGNATMHDIISSLQDKQGREGELIYERALEIEKNKKDISEQNKKIAKLQAQQKTEIDGLYIEIQRIAKIYQYTDEQIQEILLNEYYENTAQTPTSEFNFEDETANDGTTSDERQRIDGTRSVTESLFTPGEGSEEQRIIDAIKERVDLKYEIARTLTGYPERFFTFMTLNEFYPQDTAISLWNQYSAATQYLNDEIAQLLKDYDDLSKPTFSVNLNDTLEGDFVFVKSAMAFGALLNLMSSTLGENSKFTMQDVVSYINADDPSGRTSTNYFNAIKTAATVLQQHLEDHIDESSFYNELYNRFDFTNLNVDLTLKPIWYDIESILKSENKKQELAQENGIFPAIINIHDINSYLPVNGFENNVMPITDHKVSLLTNMLYNREFGKELSVEKDVNYIVDDSRYSYDTTKDDSNMIPIAVIDKNTGLKIGQVVTIPYIAKGIVHMFNNYWFDIPDTMSLIEEHYDLLLQLKRYNKLLGTPNQVKENWLKLYDAFQEQYNINRGDNAVNPLLTPFNDHNKIQDAITHIAKVATYGSGAMINELSSFNAITIANNINNWRDQVTSQLLHARKIRAGIATNNFITNLKRTHGGTIMFSQNVNDTKVQTFRSLLDVIAVTDVLRDIDGNIIKNDKGTPIPNQLILEEQERINNTRIYFKQDGIGNTVYNAENTAERLHPTDRTKDYGGVTHVGIAVGNQIVPILTFNPMIKDLVDSKLYTTRLYDLVKDLFKESSIDLLTMTNELNKVIRMGSGTNLNFRFSNSSKYGEIIQPELELKYDDKVLDKNGNEITITRAIKIIKPANGKITILQNTSDTDNNINLSGKSRKYINLKEGIVEGNPDFMITLEKVFGEQHRNVEYNKKDGFGHQGEFTDFITNKTYPSYKDYIIRTNAIVTDLAAYIDNNNNPISNVSADGIINLRMTIDMTNLTPINEETTTTTEEQLSSVEKADDIVPPSREEQKKIEIPTDKPVSIDDISTPYTDLTEFTSEERDVVDLLGGKDFRYVFITKENKEVVDKFVNENSAFPIARNIVSQSAIRGDSFVLPDIPKTLFIGRNGKGIILHETIHTKLQSLSLSTRTQLFDESKPIIDFIKNRVKELTNIGTSVPIEIVRWLELMDYSKEELFTYPFEVNVIGKWLNEQKYTEGEVKNKSIFRTLIEKFLTFMGIEGSVLDEILNTLENYITDIKPSITTNGENYIEGMPDIQLSMDLTQLSNDDIIMQYITNKEVEAVCGF